MVMKGLKRTITIIMAVAVLCHLFGIESVNVKADAIDDTTTVAVTGDGDDTLASSVLYIDNINCFSGMSKSYSKGYAPETSNGYTDIIIPIKSKTDLKDNVLKASLNLGEVENTPFVYKSYIKDIYLTDNKISRSNKFVKEYMVKFRIKLKKKRHNGTYPVTIHLSATDKKQNPIEQDFTVCVTVKDGKNLNETEPITELEPETEPETTPSFEPKVIVKSYKLSKTNVVAGDDVTATVTLLNTNKSEIVKNLTVVASSESEFLQLTDKSDTVYISSIGAGGTAVIKVKYKILLAATPAQYDLTLTMSYADSMGTAYSQTGKIKTIVGQKSRIQFDDLAISSEAEIGDTIEAQANAMNLGKGTIYNVRGEIEADGLTPAGTIYIGNIEPGSMGSATTKVVVDGLKNEASPYGVTKGTITFYYEDANGKERHEKKEFTVKIKSIKSVEKENQQDKPAQWWTIMSVIIIVIIGIGAVIGYKEIKRRKN